MKRDPLKVKLDALAGVRSASRARVRPDGARVGQARRHGGHLGPAYAALLALEPERSTAFLQRVLTGDDRALRFEAASAFAQMRGDGGLAIAEAYLRTDGTLDAAQADAALRTSRFLRDAG